MSAIVACIKLVTTFVILQCLLPSNSVYGKKRVFSDDLEEKSSLRLPLKHISYGTENEEDYSKYTADEEPAANSNIKTNSYKEINSDKAYKLSQAVPAAKVQKQSFTLAQPILAVQQQPQTLAEIYKSQLLSPQQDIVLYLKFATQFDQWNPRDNNSQWRWIHYETDYPADNAYIKRYGNSAYEEQHSYDAAAAAAKNIQHEKKDGVSLVSFPFSRYRPNSDELAHALQYEGAVEWKNNVTISGNISSGERILFRIKYACEIVDSGKHPFPGRLVSNEWDDIRLGQCAFGINDINGGLFFNFATTNTGVWAVYGSRQGFEFISVRRVGLRHTYDDLVDAAIEYDSFQNVVNYYLNGVKVWSIYALGAPPLRDGLTKIDLGQGTLRLTRPTAFGVYFGTAKTLDQSDPNNQNETERLVRVQDNSTYYPRDAKFYDNASLRFNNIWGRGAKMTVFKLLIARIELRQQQQPLPAVPTADAYNNNNVNNNNAGSGQEADMRSWNSDYEKK